MKWIQLLVIMIMCNIAIGQPRDLTPTKKNQAFGSRDFRNLRSYGFQFQLGATYLMNRLKNPTHDVTPTTGGFRGNFQHDPHGKLGAYAEIGMFHFPKKRSKLSLALKTVLVSYYDWGIGFKYFRGREDIVIQFLDQTGTAIGPPTVDEADVFNFEFGHIYGRFSLHKNIHFKTNRGRDKSKFFLDNSLGINVDYRVMLTTDPYTATYPITTSIADQRYTSPLHIQLHYGLGFGFRMKRGSYLIPGVRLPLFGHQMTQSIPSNSVSGKSTFGNPAFHWFSTKQWPILFHIKYMFVLEKKNKNSCPPAETNDKDKETQRNR